MRGTAGIMTGRSSCGVRLKEAPRDEMLARNIAASRSTRAGARARGSCIGSLALRSLSFTAQEATTVNKIRPPFGNREATPESACMAQLLSPNRTEPAFSTAPGATQAASFVRPTRPLRNLRRVQSCLTSMRSYCGSMLRQCHGVRPR